MKNKIFFALVSVLIILVCINITTMVLRYTNKLDMSQRQYNSNYPSLDYQVEVSVLLKEASVPHKIDNRGFLWYRKRDKELVENLYDKVNRKHFPEWPNITYNKEETQEYFTSLLEKENIPYIVRKLDANGNNYILWNPAYDEQVREIQHPILAEVIKK